MLLLSRRIREHRPTIVLVVLVVLSLASLASGTQGSVVGEGVRTAVCVAAYPFLKAFNGVKGALAYASGFVLSYDASRREVTLLQERLAQTEVRLAGHAELRRENERLRNLLEFQREEPKLHWQVAEVMARAKGAIVVDRGLVHGVEEFTCAITKDGMVGAVAEVKPLISFVYTLRHSQCRVGVMTERTRVTGVLCGSGSESSAVCTIEYIDPQADVREGDRVVTSGESMFPVGLPIGEIVELDRSPLQQTAYVEPFAAPYRLDEVLLVRAAAPAQEELAWPAGAETEGQTLDDVPGSLSIQDRYAP